MKKSEEKYEVERIIGHRTRGNRQEILVHWKGDDVSENMFLPESELGN